MFWDSYKIPNIPADSISPIPPSGQYREDIKTDRQAQQLWKRPPARAGGGGGVTEGRTTSTSKLQPQSGGESGSEGLQLQSAKAVAGESYKNADSWVLTPDIMSQFAGGLRNLRSETTPK